MNLNKPPSCHVLQWISKGPSLLCTQCRVTKKYSKQEIAPLISSSELCCVPVNSNLGYYLSSPRLHYHTRGTCYITFFSGGVHTVILLNFVCSSFNKKKKSNKRGLVTDDERNT